MKEISRKATKYQVSWESLLQLFSQQAGKCKLTGELLTADNMELDHITAKSVGGGNLIDNLRWVTKSANRAKQHLSDEDFLLLCQKVVATLT